MFLFSFPFVEKVKILQLRKDNSKRKSFYDELVLHFFVGNSCTKRFKASTFIDDDLASKNKMLSAYLSSVVATTAAARRITTLRRTFTGFTF